MNKEQIKQLVTEAVANDPLKNTIQSISLFGSFLHGDYSEKSDVDLLIELKQTPGFLTLMAMQNRIEDKVGRPVQLLTKGSISKHFRTAVIAEAETIYSV
jgi:predicted nucleotidyltransferase